MAEEKKKETFEEELQNWEQATENVVEPIEVPSEGVEPDYPANPEL